MLHRTRMCIGMSSRLPLLVKPSDYPYHTDIQIVNNRLNLVSIALKDKRFIDAWDGRDLNGLWGYSNGTARGITKDRDPIVH